MTRSGKPMGNLYYDKNDPPIDTIIAELKDLRLQLDGANLVELDDYESEVIRVILDIIHITEIPTYLKEAMA
jgi:hypothetical protein